MLKNTMSQTILLTFLVILIISLPGTIITLGYWWLVSHEPNLSLTLYQDRQEVAKLFVGVVTTLLGFVAASVSILFGLNGRRYFSEYEGKGFLSIFKFIYLFFIMFSIFSILVCVAATSSSSSAFLFRASVFMSVNSIFYAVS